ncbi:MAG: DUF4867 family protein [Lachnospiraceae bacterium]
MEIYQITDEKFRKYGRIIKDIDITELIEKLGTTPVPEDVVYEPSIAELESLTAAKELSKIYYGEMPIQIGYCNGHNKKLNAAEYHRSSEVNIAATDAVLILGLQADVSEEHTYETSRMEAFFVPAGMAVEVFATSLHYAPCNPKSEGFQVGIVLPRGTNLPLEHEHSGGEDGIITAKNKWLIGHKEGGLPEGSHIGLIGENLTIA